MHYEHDYNPIGLRRAPSTARRAPSAEAMTAPRAREQTDPPSPPDRRPPRRGAGSSPSIYAASAAGRRVPPVARHGLVRSARALAAAALLALAGALFLPATAEAQTATTLVSNTGQLTDVLDNKRAVSQRFTTGSNEEGYTLTGVDVVSASSTGFTAQVCGVDSDTLKPTSTCTDLTAPGTFAVGTMSFIAPTDTPLLTKSTTYAVVVTAHATNTADAAAGETYTGVAQGWGLAGTNGEDADLHGDRDAGGGRGAHAPVGRAGQHPRSGYGNSTVRCDGRPAVGTRLTARLSLREPAANRNRRFVSGDVPAPRTA